VTDDELRVKSVYYRKKLLKYILGHGLAFSVGVAIAAKKDLASYKVYTLLGDGELAEGSNWESVMAAYHADEEVRPEAVCAAVANHFAKW
jgi:hypothetical protein